MSKTLISGVIIGVVIVGGYFLLQANKGAENTQVENSESGEQPDEKRMAFSEFVKQGGSYKCEVKQATSDFENSGTVYISGNNMRGEFSTVAEGRTMETSFISKDGYMYNWSSALPNMGFKAKIAASGTSASADISGNYSWNADQIGDYNCEAWTVDQSKFTLPVDITFKEMGA